MTKATLILALLVSLASDASAQLVINEAMINEPGGFTNLEWVELFNRGPDTCDLENYIFIEGDDTTRFEGLEIPANGFVVLARRLHSSDEAVSFESWWGDSSGSWGDAEIERYPVVEAKMSLRNSDDKVELVNVSSDLVEEVRWEVSPPDGVSWERRNPNIEAAKGNFDFCTSESGSTPGKANSILAPPNDLGIELDSLQKQLAGDSGGEIALFLSVRNEGLNRIDGLSLQVVLDRDISHDISAADSTWKFEIPALEPGGAAALDTRFQSEVGRISLLALLPDDDYEENNSIDTTFALGSHFGELLINELQLSSEMSNGGEWIELRNVAQYSMDAGRFLIGQPGLELKLGGVYLVDPGNLVMICQDSIALRSVVLGSGCALIQLSPWIGLDDGGGTVRVVSDLGSLSDSVVYLSAPGVGVSWELDSDTVGSKFLDWFYSSSSEFGSTPCEANSPRILPPSLDIEISADSLLREYLDDEMSQLKVAVKLQNVGLLDAPAFTIAIYDDFNLDQSTTPDELIRQIQVKGMVIGEAIWIEAELALEAGFHQLIWLLPTDDNIDNNGASVECSFGPLTSEVIITEYLANPEDEFSCEWVELQNISERSIDLTGWRFGDAVKLNELIAGTWLEAHEYAVVTEDVDCPRLTGSSVCQHVSTASWSALNNNGDMIILRDQFGVVSDSFTYLLTAEGGRSIELNQDAFANGQRFWYPSTSPEYSSPCQPNSVSGAEDAPITVKIEKPVFAPGEGEELEVKIACPPATALTIEVFDLVGRRHFTVADRRLFSSSSVYYSGDSDLVGRLEVGAYILLVTGGDGDVFNSKIGFAVAPDR